MKKIILIILTVALVIESIILIRERDLRRQADEVIEAYRTYELMQDEYTGVMEESTFFNIENATIYADRDGRWWMDAYGVEAGE